SNFSRRECGDRCYGRVVHAVPSIHPRFRRCLREGQHGAGEYVRGDAHTNTSECRFSLMKRAVFGAHHSISEAHLPRYLAEWDFKWNTRKISDGERAAAALKGI